MIDETIKNDIQTTNAALANTCQIRQANSTAKSDRYRCTVLKQVRNPAHHILMLHGLGDEADTWRHIFHPFSNYFHTLALDLPGFGRSDKPDVVYSPQFLMGTR
jgi:pimeloyl-ACP methyl ester carboxylesterase